MAASMVATIALMFVSALVVAQPAEAACVLQETAIDTLAAQWTASSPDDPIVPCIQEELGKRKSKSAGCRTYEEVTKVLRAAFTHCLAQQRAGLLERQPDTDA